MQQVFLEGGKLLQLNPAVKSQKELFGQKNQSVYCRILPLKKLFVFRKRVCKCW